MDQLNRILAEATEGIAPTYFNLPIDNGGPIYRERVYCYELYHQLRKLWPAPDVTNFVINGEIDKRGHPLLHNFGIPDFLIHVPGNMDENYAVIEVKPGDTVAGNLEAIRTDLRKLSRFQNDAQYERGLYLFYGKYPRADLHRAIEGLGELRQIEIWHHAGPGEQAKHIETIEAA